MTAPDRPVGDLGYEVDLLEDLYRRRDEDRERKKTAVHVVRGRERAFQDGRMGLIKWYMHPALTDASIRSLVVFVQELPPGGRSGKEHFQGGRVMFILAGSGYTILEGVRHDWTTADVVMLPIRPEGVTYQHFNASTTEPARFIAAEADLSGPLGIELGVRREILEPAPGRDGRGGA